MGVPVPTDSDGAGSDGIGKEAGDNNDSSKANEAESHESNSQEDKASSHGADSQDEGAAGLTAEFWDQHVAAGFAPESWEEHLQRFGKSHKWPRCRWMRNKTEWQAILT